MKKAINPFVMMLTMLVLASISCQAATNNGSPNTNSDNPTAAKVKYSDDFSNTGSGWDVYSGDNSFVGYYLNAYKVSIINQTDYYVWANPKSSLSFANDQIIDVDASLESGSEMNDIGVICRYQDEENFYFLTISSDGYYGISKIVKGDESLVGMEELGKNTDVIKSGKETNHIQASCIGSSLSLSANGTELVSVSDSDLATGTVGLLVGTYSEGDVSVLFDNFKVSVP